MTWLINGLLDAVRTVIANFIADAINVVNNIFLDLLSCDMNLFEELFHSAKTMYQNVIVPIGVALVLLILLWKLFASMFGKMGTNSEDPVRLVFRSAMCLVLVLYAKKIVNYILAFAGTPYSWIVGEGISAGSFSEMYLEKNTIVEVLGIDNFNCNLLLLIMQFVVAWNYFKLIYVVAERYVLLGIMTYTSPLAFATGGSTSTERILSSWCSMFGGQVVLIMLDAWGLKLFLSGYAGILASGYGFQKYFAACMCLVGFSKIIQKLDSYLASLGISMGRTYTGMSGMAVAMMAGRFLSRGSHSHGSHTAASGYTAGGSGNAAGGIFSAENGAAGIPVPGSPIPMQPEGMESQGTGAETGSEDPEDAKTGKGMPEDNQNPLGETETERDGIPADEDEMPEDEMVDHEQEEPEEFGIMPEEDFVPTEDGQEVPGMEEEKGEIPGMDENGGILSGEMPDGEQLPIGSGDRNGSVPPEGTATAGETGTMGSALSESGSVGRMSDGAETGMEHEAHDPDKTDSGRKRDSRVEDMAYHDMPETIRQERVTGETYGRDRDFPKHHGRGEQRHFHTEVTEQGEIRITEQIPGEEVPDGKR